MTSACHSSISYHSHPQQHHYHHPGMIMTTSSSMKNNNGSNQDGGNKDSDGPGLKMTALWFPPRSRSSHTTNIMAPRSAPPRTSGAFKKNEIAGNSAHSFYILPTELYGSCDRDTESALIRDLKACCWEQQGFELSTQERTGQTARRSLTLRLRMRCANHTKKRGCCPFRFTVFWNVSQQFWYFCPPTSEEEVQRFCHAPTCVPYWMSSSTTTTMVPRPLSPPSDHSSSSDESASGAERPIATDKKTLCLPTKNETPVAETKSLVQLLAGGDVGPSFSSTRTVNKVSPADAAAFSLIAAKQKEFFLSSHAALNRPSNPRATRNRTTLTSAAVVAAKKRSTAPTRATTGAGRNGVQNSPSTPPKVAVKEGGAKASHKSNISDDTPFSLFFSQESGSFPSPWSQTNSSVSCPTWDSEHRPSVSLQEAAQAVLYSLGGGEEMAWSNDDDHNEKVKNRASHQEEAMESADDWLNLFLSGSSSHAEDTEERNHCGLKSASGNSPEICGSAHSSHSTSSASMMPPPAAHPQYHNISGNHANTTEYAWSWNYPTFSAPSA